MRATRRPLVRKSLGILKLVAINILVFVLLFLLAELGFRTVCFVIGRGFTKENRFISPWFTAYDYPPPKFDAQGNAYFRHRDRPVTKDKGDLYRVIAVGGSTTANIRPFLAGGVDYAIALERLLNAGADNGPYEVLNAGAEAYSTAHSLINISLRLVDFEPDLIILMHNLNDASANSFGDGVTSDYSNKYMLPYYLNPRLQANLSFQGLLFQSRLLCYLDLPQTLARRARVIRPDNPTAAGMRIFKRNLKSIISICRTHGMGLLLLTQPHQDTDHKYIHLKVVQDYNRAIEQIAREQNVHFFDMEAAFGKKPKFFNDMFHYTPAGIERFAQLLAPVVTRIQAGQTGQATAHPQENGH